MVNKDQIHLNNRLIDRQGLNDTEVDNVKELHLELERFFDEVSNLNPRKISEIDANSIVDTVERIEFAMQEAWKFEPNSKMHSWWFRTPHCKCPHMDNQDVLGTDLRYISSSCPLHGKGYVGTIKDDITIELAFV